MSGLGSRCPPPRSTERSPRTDQWPPALGAPTASSGDAGMALRRRRPTGRGRRGRPGPSTHERTIRVRPSEPTTGMTHVMQTPTPQAMDSSTATCATAPCAWATRVIDSQHPHRAAAVDDPRARALDDLGQQVADPAPLTGRAVVGRHRDPVAAAPGLDDAEEPVLARGAEHHLDVAAALAQLGRRARRAGRCRSHRRRGRRHRLGRQRERPCRAARRRRRVVRRAADDPPGAGADGRDDDLDGAAVGAARADLVDRERPPQQGAGRLAADGQGDELPGPGELGDAGRDEGEVLVRADPPGRDDLRDLLRDPGAQLRSLMRRPLAVASRARGRRVPRP